MGRPIYETEDSLETERKIATWLMKKWQYMTCHKLPRSYIADYAMCGADCRIHRYVEIRCREMAWNDHPDKFISMSKYVRCLSLARNSQTPVYLVIMTTKDRQIGYWEIEPYDANTGFYTSMNGRLPKSPKYRNDPADWEPVLHIPNDQFVMYKKKDKKHNLYLTTG
jgi:hypothetical protein